MDNVVDLQEARQSIPRIGKVTYKAENIESFPNKKSEDNPIFDSLIETLKMARSADYEPVGMVACVMFTNGSLMTAVNLDDDVEVLHSLNMLDCLKKVVLGTYDV